MEKSGRFDLERFLRILQDYAVAVSDSPEPAETEAPEAEATTSDKSGTAPDFSACDGLTGLDIAICRHQ